MKRAVVNSQDNGAGTCINSRKCHYHILTNRNRFSLHHALILVLDKEGGQIYRLVVYHNEQFLTDLLYYSLRGAKIAFIKLYKKRAYSEEVEAEWKEIYGYLNKLSPPLTQLPSLNLFEIPDKYDLKMTE